MLKRVVSKYDKISHGHVDEYEVKCQVDEMCHLFNTFEDPEMIYVYKIADEKQIEFFVKLGVPIDDTGYFYLESYDE